MSKLDNTKLCKIGSRDLYVAVTKYQEDLKIHIRQYFTAYPKKLFPSRVGVTLNLKEYLDILATSGKVKGYISDIEGIKEKSKERKRKEPASSGSGTGYYDIELEKEKSKARKRKEEVSSGSSSSSSEDELANEPRRKKIKKV